jgi:hypothetical protein
MSALSSVVFLGFILGVRHATDADHERVNRDLATASGLPSPAVSRFLVDPVGVADGLFSGDPHWTPE